MRSSAVHKKSAKDDRLDALFGALADRTRRAMLAQLARAPTKVTDLAAPFAISLPAISRHLRVLEGAGLVSRRIDGRVHLCSLERQRLDEAGRWIARNREFWSETLDALVRHVEKASKPGARP
jgi:DNA-binding transcriptional ArsR family regulator